MSRTMKWEVTLKKVDALIAASNATLYDRVVLLKEVWDNPDFLAFHKQDVDKAEEHLNGKLGDYGLTIFDCLSLLKHFPQREKWEGGKLRELLATALDAEDKSRASAGAPKAERKGPVARGEFEKLQDSLAHMNSRADSLAEENGRLRAENAQLRSDLDHARGQILELQRILRKELVAA